jgi:hypothetical protein
VIGIKRATAIVAVSPGPVLAAFALKFGPAEYFILAVMGLASIVTLTSENLLKGLISGLLGLIIATIGTDPISGEWHYTFGFYELVEGVSFMPALIGLFSITQMLSLTEKSRIAKDSVNIKSIKREKMPKKLGSSPEIGSVPIVAMINPSKPDISPLRRFSDVKVTILANPITARIKYSAGPNFNANAANTGAMSNNIIVENTPPVKLATTETFRATPAFPILVSGYPSKAVVAAAGVPGVESKIAEIDPPYIAPL